MYYDNIIEKTKRGEPLTNREIKFLKTDIGLVIPAYKLILYILAILLGVILIFCSFGITDLYARNIYFLIMGCFIFSWGATKIIFRNSIVMIDDYLAAIHTYYETFKSQYSDMRFTFSLHIPSPYEYLVKKQVLVFSDGYLFIIYDDFLMDTSYLLGHSSLINDDNPNVIKVFDPNTVHKEPLIFKINEIESYALVHKTTALKKDLYIYDPYINTHLNFDYFDYCKIKLISGRTFHFGNNMYLLLREFIPKKETIL